ncbi:hypothetical protein GCM10025882_25180 [Acinetobacter gyllenbergii]|uniref:Uncharacterized protein n=1 Tax=Acinetobacter gyllenbergii CIP 110306 = MTCC 11365 TaxID=1217657 RepID=A0A829HJU0_9GAMM|nr:hypothetical protein [Acinetobacter gyllenbergii]EPF83450.1 hypothetical protein F957_01796 [Acinetobacter gyllenbergii CIP 110306 = MTCC 11365]EPH35525.1 hypothetical protein L293_0116 [Acinetobacter gyllenbergii CIP 110306 = MTCC 11365]GMA12093.1 hypothetical protein GCM10025882_25180 [Acinetobacter gyllenbergii]
MFVQLNHLKSKELQSDLDAIHVVFEVSLFDIVDQTESSNTLAIHQQMLLNCEHLAIEKELDLNTLIIEKLDSTLVDIDSLDKPNLFSGHNWFLNLLESVIDPPYGTTLAHSNRVAFFKKFTQLCLLTEKDCEIYDWVGYPGSGRDNDSEWNDYFEPSREWSGNWCLTIYSPQQNKGCLLLASSTD